MQRGAQQRVALGVDDDRTNNERVLPARPADRHVHRRVLRLAADDQATVGDPASLPDVASLAGPAQGIEGSEPAAGLGREVSAGAQVIAMPLRPGPAHEDTERDDDRCDDVVDRPHQQPDQRDRRRPAPMQVKGPHPDDDHQPGDGCAAEHEREVPQHGDEMIKRRGHDAPLAAVRPANGPR
ncbi:MAG: hypothetical protein ACXVFK_04605 [Solirubrobacteraceae bacterium]